MQNKISITDLFDKSVILKASSPRLSREFLTDYLDGDDSALEVIICRAYIVIFLCKQIATTTGLVLSTVGDILNIRPPELLDSFRTKAKDDITCLQTLCNLIDRDIYEYVTKELGDEANNTSSISTN